MEIKQANFGTIVRYKGKLHCIARICENDKQKVNLAIDVTFKKGPKFILTYDDEKVVAISELESAELSELNVRQRAIVLYAIFHIPRISNLTSMATYSEIKKAFGEPAKYCRGIGQSCSAIYRKGIREIHQLVVNQQGNAA